jgi:hypothetical protein
MIQLNYQTKRIMKLIKKDICEVARNNIVSPILIAMQKKDCCSWTCHRLTVEYNSIVGMYITE